VNENVLCGEGGMGKAEQRMRMTEYRMVAKYGNGRGRENDRTGNGGRTRNGRLPL
jgi:hypothetical protein